MKQVQMECPSYDQENGCLSTGYDDIYLKSQ